MKKRKDNQSEMSMADHIRIARSKVPQQSVQTTLDCRPSLPSESGTRRVKRVRFEEPDTQYPLTCEPNACLRNSCANVSHTSGNPKTSEFAFYKKLREDAAHSSHLYNQHTQQKQREESEARNYTEDIAKIVKPNYEIRSFSAIEKETPTALVSTISPRVPVSSGSECKHKDIFSIKREKLIHLAADSLSLDLDTLCSKGYDLIPMLLQRLHPDNNAIAETSCSRSRSESVDTKVNNNSQLHVSLDSDIHVKEIPWSPSVNLVSPFTREKSESSLLCSWSDTPQESSFSHEFDEDWGSVSERFPQKIILKCERTHLDDIVDCSEPSRLYAKVESDFNMKLGAEFHVNENDCLALDYMPNQPSLLCPTFGNLSSNTELSDTLFVLNSRSSFKWSESDGISSPNILASLSKQRNQLSSWSPYTVEKEYLSHSSRGAELNTSLTWGTTAEDYLQCPNSIFTTRSVQSILQCSDPTLRNMSSGIYLTDTVRSQDLREEGSILTCHPNQIILQCERTHPDDIVDYSEPSNLYTKVDSDFSIKPGAEFHVNEDDCIPMDYMQDQPSLFCPTYRSLSSDSGLSSDKSLMLHTNSNFKWRYALSSPSMFASLGKQHNQLLSWSPRTVERETYISNSSRASPSEGNLHSPNSTFSPSVRSICHNSDLTLRNMSSGKCLTDTVGLQTPDVVRLTWDNSYSPNCRYSSTGMNSPYIRSISQCSDLTLMNIPSGNYLTDAVESQTSDVGKYQVEDPGYYPLRLCCTPTFLGFTG